MTGFHSPIALGERRNSTACGSTDTAEMTVGDIRVHSCGPLHPSTYAKRKASNARSILCYAWHTRHKRFTVRQYCALPAHSKIYFFTFFLTQRSRDSSAGMVTRVQGGQSRNRDSNPSNSSSTQAPINGYGGGRCGVRWNNRPLGLTIRHPPPK